MLSVRDYLDIDEAAYWIGVQLRRWGCISVVQTKEKWGEARVYCSFGIESHWWDILVLPYQKWVYRRVYARALCKWPQQAKAILMGADWHEHLVGLDSRLVYKQIGESYHEITWTGDTGDTECPY